MRYSLCMSTLVFKFHLLSVISCMIQDANTVFPNAKPMCATNFRDLPPFKKDVSECVFIISFL